MPLSLGKTQVLIVKKMVICFVVIIIAIVVPIFLQSVSDSYDEQYKKLGNEIKDLKQRLEGLNKKTLEFSDDVKRWEALSEDDRKLQGLRINDARDILEKLQNKYKFTSVKTSFSKPDEIGADYKTDTVSMYASIVSVNFNSVSDDLIYSFMSELTQVFPGIVQIKSCTINKPAMVTKEVLKKISAGEDAQVISVTLEFYWHDLKYKGPANSSATPSPPGGEPKK